MDFRIDAVLPATPAKLWSIFFDVQRIAGLIPGCENVTEIEPFKEFSAVLKQRIGPFRLEVPTRILIESHTVERQVVLVASGADKLTGTTIDVRMKVDLDEQREGSAVACRLAVEAGMQVAGRLASLGYPIVRKRSEELFGEFERRLRMELDGVEMAPARSPAMAGTTATKSTPAPANPATPATHATPAVAPAAAGVNTADTPAPSPPSAPRLRDAAPPRGRPGRVELVLVWPRVGITLAMSVAVAYGAVAFDQSPWWWLVAPLLGVAAGLDRRQD